MIWLIGGLVLIAIAAGAIAHAFDVLRNHSNIHGRF